MDPLKVVEKTTNEIIEKLLLPKKLCFPFIKKMISWVYVAGWEEGISYRTGKVPVIKMDQYGNILDIYRSLREAAYKNGLRSQSINAVCKGENNTHGGFYWKYVEGKEQIKKIIEGWQEKL